MASSKSSPDHLFHGSFSLDPAKLPKPKQEEDPRNEDESEPPLPQTLVRIPTQHAPALLEQANAGATAD